MTDDFIAGGNDELGELIKKGDKVTNGTYTGIVEYGIDTRTKKESNVMGFITTEEGNSYLVSIQDRLVAGWEKISG